jgi:AraC family transcriptional regulator
MSRAIRFVKGHFGRTALLEMNAPLVTHAHHHCHVLLKTGGADATFQVREASCPLIATQSVLVNAWEPHAYLHQRHSQATTEILALYIEPSWLATAGLAAEAAGATHLFPQPVVMLTARALRLAQDLADSLRDERCEAGARFETLLAELMISITEPFRPACRGRRYIPQGITRAPQDGRIRRAMAIMRENVGMDMDLNAVAVHCGLSRAHFFELFRRTASVTPAIYTNELRMEAAFDWLAQPRDPIARVADRLGFSAPGHFTRFFRGHIGITPRAYRQAVSDARSGSRDAVRR